MKSFSMLVTSQFAIQTAKIFHSFLTCTCAPTLSKCFRHPWAEVVIVEL